MSPYLLIVCAVVVVLLSLLVLLVWSYEGDLERELRDRE